MAMRPEAKGNPRAASTRLKSISATKVNGQRRHDMRIGVQPKYVDKDRASFNRHLIPAATSSELVAICETRRLESGVERKRVVKSNVAVATIGIITFGREAQQFFGDISPENQDLMLLEIADAIAARLGTTLTGLSYHGDEASPHGHYQMPATSIYGTPVSQIMTKAVLNELQTMTAKIAQKYDPRFERGNRKIDRLEAGADIADVTYRTTKEMRDQLLPDHTAMVEENSVLAAEIEGIKSDIQAAIDKRETQKRLLSKAESALQAAELTIQKAATLEKRIKTYETRIQTSEDDLSRLEGLQTEAENKIKEARDIEFFVDRATRFLGHSVRAVEENYYNTEVFKHQMLENLGLFEQLQDNAPNNRPTRGFKLKFLGMDESFRRFTVPSSLRNTFAKAFDAIAEFAQAIAAQAELALEAVKAREEAVTAREKAVVDAEAAFEAERVRGYEEGHAEGLTEAAEGLAAVEAREEAVTAREAALAHAEDVSEAWKGLEAAPEPIEQAVNDRMSLFDTVGEVLDGLDLSDNAAYLAKVHPSERDLNGDPPPVRSLVFDRAQTLARKKNQLVADRHAGRGRAPS